MNAHRALFAGFFLIVAAVAAPADDKTRPGMFDWPQWQGPDRTAMSHETGLLQDWPQGGPPLLWKAGNLGGGYSAPAVAGGLVVGMSFRGSDEVVWALDEANGKELWHTVIAGKAQIGYDQGSRGTPTIDDGKVYALGVGGDLVCLDAKTGAKVWTRNFLKDFSVDKVPQWGYSESPLVEGDLVLATPGGENTIVALHKKDGTTAWVAKVPQKDAAHYSSLLPVTIDGQKQYIQFLKGGVVAVSPEGKFLWRYDHPANGVANIATVVVSGNDVFASSAYRKGAGMVEVKKKGAGFEAREVYFNPELQNHHGGLILLDGYIYGAHGGNGDSAIEALVCMDFKTGKIIWKNHDEAGKGSLAFADGRLYYRNEKGTMLLVEPTPKGYIEHGRFTQPDRSKQQAWPHPVIANGKLFLRDQDNLFVYDIKKK